MSYKDFLAAKQNLMVKKIRGMITEQDFEKEISQLIDQVE